MRCDLHLHSDRSDGSLAVRDLVREVARAGVTLFALTDHDTVDGLDEARGGANRLCPLASRRWGRWPPGAHRAGPTWPRLWWLAVTSTMRTKHFADSFVRARLHGCPRLRRAPRRRSSGSMPPVARRCGRIHWPRPSSVPAGLAR